MRVRYSPLALLQLEEIHHYIAQHNPPAARAVVARIQDLCEKLGEFPGVGSKTDQPGVRVLPVVRYPYLIFYLLIPATDEVRILRIRHGRRKPLQPGRV
jgi:toxin ParE1/3/4